jgi:hypothetical protein
VQQVETLVEEPLRHRHARRDRDVRRPDPRHQPRRRKIGHAAGDRTMTAVLCEWRERIGAQRRNRHDGHGGATEHPHAPL